MFDIQKTDQPRKWSFAISFAAQTLGIALLVQLGLMEHKARLQPSRPYDMTELVAPAADVTPLSKPISKPLLAPDVRRLETTSVAKLAIPPEVAPPQLKMEPKFVATPVAQISAPAVNTAVPSIETAKREVKTDVFSGSSAQQTIRADQRRVQTGGFGDSNGIAANPRQLGQAGVHVSHVGAFDLPQGQGYGNGSGGAKGIKGVVASAGFGNGVAASDSAVTGKGGGGLRAAAFSDGRAATVEPKPKVVQMQIANTRPVEVVSKPKPAYTAEAREQKIEGEVLLDVMFTASGQVKVIRVVRGLGHGLDESAVRAAEQIKFRPATRDGQSVDSTARIHIVFQIA